MSVDQLNSALDGLDHAVTDRLKDESDFKESIFKKINQILSEIKPSAESVVRATGDARGPAVQDFTDKVQILEHEIRRLKEHRLTDEEADKSIRALRDVAPTLRTTAEEPSQLRQDQSVSPATSLGPSITTPDKLRVDQSSGPTYSTKLPIPSAWSDQPPEPENSGWFDRFGSMFRPKPPPGGTQIPMGGVDHEDELFQGRRDEPVSRVSTPSDRSSSGSVVSYPGSDGQEEWAFGGKRKTYKRKTRRRKTKRRV